MTPAEHYTQAEDLLRRGADAESFAAAQAHATLAVAGATFLAATAGMYPTAANEFADAITPTPHPLAGPLAQANAAARAALGDLA